MAAAFWIVSKPKYIEEARQSADSLRTQMPAVARILFSPDGIERAPEFQSVVKLPKRESDLWYLDCTRYLGIALDWLNESGHEKLVYLDSDTYVVYPFWEMFDVLDRFDFAAAHAPRRITSKTVRPVPACFPELNIGVMALWNKAPLRRFVQSWYRQYYAHQDVYGNNDQGSLRECLWDYLRDVNLLDTFSFCVLPPEYNCRIVGGGIFLNGPVRILHTRASNMESIVHSVNASTGARLWKLHEWYPLD